MTARSYLYFTLGKLYKLLPIEPLPPLPPPSSPGSLLCRPLSPIVSYLLGKRRCLLSLVIFNTLKQSFVIECYDESKPCQDHFASFVTRADLLFNPVYTGPWLFYIVDLWGGGKLWRSASCKYWSITVMRGHGTAWFYKTFKIISFRFSILNDDVIWRRTDKSFHLGSAIFDFMTYKTLRICQNFLSIHIFFCQRTSFYTFQNFNTSLTYREFNLGRHAYSS